MLVFIQLPEADRTATRTHAYSHIECDVCGERSPSAEVMIKHHGLANMGWFIDGGLHRCPKHFCDEAPARGPQYRDG